MTGEMLGVSLGMDTCESSDTSGPEARNLGGVEISFTPDGTAVGMIIRYGQEQQ